MIKKPIFARPWAVLWILFAILLGSPKAKSQGSGQTREPEVTPGFEEAQMEAVKATDARFLDTVARFREIVVKTWGPDAKIGRLDATEARILANIHVGEELHGVEFTPRRFRSNKKLEMSELEGTAEHLLDLSWLDETRLRRLIELAHALPDGAMAHLFKLEMIYFPDPLDRFAAAIELIGVHEKVQAAFDLATGDPLKLAPFDPSAEPTLKPVANRPRGGLREWMGAWEEVLSSLEKTGVQPLSVLSLVFSSTGATAEALEEGTLVSYRFDNQGLRKIETVESSTRACREPFDPRQVRLDLLGELADRAFASVDIPFSTLVDARIERGPICGAPEIRFLLRGPNAAAEVVFDAAGEQIRSELR